MTTETLIRYGFYAGLYTDNKEILKIVDLNTGEIFDFVDGRKLTLTKEKYAPPTSLKFERNKIIKDEAGGDDKLVPLFAGVPSARSGIIIDFDGKSGEWEY